MQDDMFYDERSDGSYVVHFGNNPGWDMEHVKTIFSKYGKVLSVNNRGQVTGLCFVRYGTIEEAKKCIDSFRNSTFIKILPHKRKLMAASTKETVAKKVPNVINQKRDNEYNSDTSSVHSEKRSSASKPKKSIGLNRTSKSSLQHSMISKLDQIRRLKGVTSASLSSVASSDKATQPNNIFNKEIPELIAADKHIQEHSMLCSQDVDQELKLKSKVIPMEEVIVANIHSSFGVHYILHLFEKYDPLSVSLVKVVPNTSIRYCHVYFKTSEEAMAIQEEFDDFSLCGNKLIVLTQSTLLAESQ